MYMYIHVCMCVCECAQVMRTVHRKGTPYRILTVDIYKGDIDAQVRMRFRIHTHTHTHIHTCVHTHMSQEIMIQGSEDA